ncbi:MAG TPA: metallophosphoesterase family protein [Longimicrobiaceae bacterium]|nr:metallophosphoesterase family protein [Longimicrobiaceae bacterium]
MAAPVAALYDVHGNLPALEAALAAADDAGAELILVGGDVVLGPMPRECLERFTALGPRARFIRGNADRLVADACDGRTAPNLPAIVQDRIAWCAAQLGRDHRDFLAHLPLSLSVDVEGVGPVLFCHGTPRSDDEIVTVRTPEERAREMLAGAAEPLVVCGHTHMQFDRTVGGTRLVNAGSVGMPYGAPGAHWLLLDGGVRLVRTGYDLPHAADAIRATGFPDAGGFARDVTEPASEETVLALFDRR